MKKSVYIFLLLMIPINLSAYTFTRNLQIGSTGDDVLQLQKYLNTNTSTQVATEGIGSPDNETIFFGIKTQQAVIRLQNLFADIILKPLGLTSGTGYVGPSTLNFLNSTQTSSSTPSINQTVLNTNTNQILYEGVPQFLISKQVVQQGQAFSVGSQNKISNTNFYLDSIQLSKKCPTEYTCELSIPSKTKTGSYKISTDNKSWGEYNISILDSSIKRPKINTKTLSISKENLIKGKDFSKNITIYTMFGVFKSETSNNSFILEFPNEYASSSPIKEGIFYVENEDGLASDILSIPYEI